MNIAYLIDGELSLMSPNSVMKKVLLQTRCWVELGNQVYIYSISSSSRLDVNKNEIITLGKAFNKGANPFYKLIKLWATSRHIFADLKILDINIVYSRYLLYSFYLDKIFTSYPSIVEINSNDDSEYKRASVFTQVYNSLFKRTLLSNVNGFVCVTNELANYISYYSNKKYLVIGNGYDFSNEQYTESIIYSVKTEPVFVFVASPGNACHGLDILLQISTHLSKYKFKIIGYEGQNSDNVTYYGYLPKVKLHEQLLEADIGVSALAIERHGMSEACPLKSREYLSYGLPVIGNYLDPDISGQEFYLRVDNSNVQYMANEIILFTDKWMNESNRKKNIISMAKPLLSHLEKEKKRLDFIKDFAEDI